jgi:cytoskeleton protein RodZ
MQVVTPVPFGSAVNAPAANATAPNASLAAATATPVAAMATAPAPATPVADATLSPATGLVVFKVTGASWVQVTDSKGNVALRRLMAAGETAGASGSLPLAVTVGSVNATAVEVRGKPFNLGPVSRDNVARFEVK